jgi:hypothetical protein
VSTDSTTTGGVVIKLATRAPIHDAITAEETTAVALPTLTHGAIAQINQEHRLARSAVESAVQHAIRCGELLLTQKRGVEHGNFKAWIATNCEFSYSTAARYMKAAGQKSHAVDFSAIRHLFPSGRKQRRESAVVTVKPASVCPKANKVEAGDPTAPTGSTSPLHRAANSESAASDAQPVVPAEPMTLERAIEIVSSSTVKKYLASELRDAELHELKCQNALHRAKQKVAHLAAALIKVAIELKAKEGA